MIPESHFLMCLIGVFLIMLKKSVLVSILGLFFSSGLFGQNVKWTHYGLRPLAMGNAFVAVADDYNVLFYNPAGLARLKEWDGEFLNPSYEISSDTLDFLQDIADLEGDVDSTLSFIKKYSGTDQHMALTWTPHLIFPGFGFGIGLEMAGSMTFHSHPSIDLNLGPTVIMPIAMALNFLEDKISFGLGIKARARAGVDHRFDIGDIEILKNDDAESKEKLSHFIEGGFGYGADFGFLFTPTEYMKPTLGISITDIGGTPFEKQSIGETAARAPKTVLASVNAGFSLTPVSADRMFIRTSADVHSINQPFSFSKKLNLGLEWGYGDIIKIQTGLHQGYLSGGFQFDVGLLNLKVVSYAEELGAMAGDKQDRRFAFQLKLLI